MTEEERQEKIHFWKGELARHKQKDKALYKIGQQIEKSHGKAYQELVKLGAAEQIKHKYRSLLK